MRIGGLSIIAVEDYHLRDGEQGQQGKNFNEVALKLEEVHETNAKLDKPIILIAFVAIGPFHALLSFFCLSNHWFKLEFLIGL